MGHEKQPLSEAGGDRCAAAVVGCWWIGGWPLPIFGGGFLLAGSVV